MTRSAMHDEILRLLAEGWGLGSEPDAKSVPVRAHVETEVVGRANIVHAEVTLRPLPLPMHSLNELVRTLGLDPEDIVSLTIDADPNEVHISGEARRHDTDTPEHVTRGFSRVFYADSGGMGPDAMRWTPDQEGA